MYNEGSEFLGHDFKNTLIQSEYGLKYRPIKLWNLTSKLILEIINQVLVNIKRIYNLQENWVDEDDPWNGLLVAAAFTILSVQRRLKIKSLCLLLFFRDTILPTKHKLDRKLIYKWNYTQNIYDTKGENKNWISQDSQLMIRSCLK